MTRSPSARRRVVIKISAIAMSAVASVSTPGVLVATMPRLGAGRNIDVVVSNSNIGHDLQLRSGRLQQLRVDSFRQQRHDCVGSGDSVQQLFARNRCGLIPLDHTSCSAEKALIASTGIRPVTTTLPSVALDPLLEQAKAFSDVCGADTGVGEPNIVALLRPAVGVRNGGGCRMTRRCCADAASANVGDIGVASAGHRVGDIREEVERRLGHGNG